MECLLLTFRIPKRPSAFMSRSVLLIGSSESSRSRLARMVMER